MRPDCAFAGATDIAVHTGVISKVLLAAAHAEGIRQGEAALVDTQPYLPQSLP